MMQKARCKSICGTCFPHLIEGLSDVIGVWKMQLILCPLKLMRLFSEASNRLVSFPFLSVNTASPLSIRAGG